MIQPKWSTRLLFLLAQRPRHFGGLKKALPGISDEVLAARLQTLAAEGVLAVAGGPAETPRCYALTERGLSLVPVLDSIAAWGFSELDRRGVSWSPPG